MTTLPGGSKLECDFNILEQKNQSTPNSSVSGYCHEVQPSINSTISSEIGVLLAGVVPPSNEQNEVPQPCNVLAKKI